MSKTHIRSIQKEAQSYTLIGNQLYRHCNGNQLQLCATKNEYLSILHEAHSRQARGYFSTKGTAKTIMFIRIWWPTLFMDAHAYVKIVMSVKGQKFQFKKMKCQ